MRSECLQFVFYAITLVLGGAVEELLPKFGGVGVPVLLALVAHVASRRPLPTLLLFALAAGAFEDALSSLPSVTSPCFFLTVALVAWRVRYTRIVAFAAYPLYQVWLKLIVPGLGGSLGVRFGISIGMSVVTTFVLCGIFAWLERKAAVDAA